MNCILHVINLKLRIENFETKTESVKTNESVSGINSDNLTEKSEVYYFRILYCTVNLKIRI